MPFLENQGVKIFFEVRGQGHPVVLLHGFTGNSQLWEMAGYVSCLERSYRVILIDQRGHGQSDKPHDSKAYSLEKRLGDVTRVLDHLGVEQASLFGYSMGGWLAFAMAVYFPERIASLIIGGAHPFYESFDPFTAVDGSDPDVFIEALLCCKNA
jgi:pimeloyl-ACP methyl ester carboxylesterase